MDLLNHDLANEYPTYIEKMRTLKMSNAHFAKLFTEYDEDNHAIAKYELGADVISEDALDALKKKRLATKDEIYQILLS